MGPKSYKCYYSHSFVTDIQKLKEIAQLRDSGILTDEEFENEKQKILNGGHTSHGKSHLHSPSYNDSVHTKRNNYVPPSSNNEYRSDQGNPKIPWIIGGIAAVFILLIIIFSLGGSSSTATVTYSGCWSGAFSDGDLNIVSIDGCGNESFNCGPGGYCGINAQKQDDSSARLCVSVGSNEACTTAEYGIASV
jgi:hypothetical protein